jgi:parvulin-like peptidyl-prolyl isomerase
MKLPILLSVICWIASACLLRAQAQEPIRVAEAKSDLLGGRGDYASFDSQQAMLSQPIARGERFEAGRMIAVVGTEPVLVGDLHSPMNVPEDALSDREFEMRLRKELANSIAKKCLAQHFLSLQTAGKSKKERDEIRSKMMAKTAEIFRTQVMPEQMKQFKCESDLEFIQLVESQGSSLPSLMRSFTESAWAEQAIREGTKEKYDTQLFELQDYYDQNPGEWERNRRARFRVLSAPFKAFENNREAAYAKIVDMGNQVYLGGAPFEAVAKQSSKGYNADEGGVFAWVSPGDLKSKVVEDAVFSIELRALSPILEDADGYYIIEVLERQEPRTVTFAEAQADIRTKLINRKKERERKEFVKNVIEKTPIWTRWPQDIPGSRDLSEIE